MTTQELFTRIDELEQKYTEFWKEICMMETPTEDKQRLDALGAFLKDFAGRLGFEICEHEEEHSGNALCFTMNPDASGVPVCFSAHMDTVHPVGAFGSIPVHMDDTYIYGPGVTDCKGGIAAGFLAMEALKSLGFSERPIKLILQSDEEVSSRLSQKRTVEFMKQMAAGSAAFLNLETHTIIGNQLPDETGPAVIIRKGILTYRFTVRGRSVHSARCQDGVSAVAEAAHKILALEKMKDKDGLTCSCSMLSGGNAPNVVPEICTFTADIRFADSDQMQEAKEFVQETAAKSFIPGSTCEAELLSYRCAMEYAQRNVQLLEKMNEIYRCAGLPLLQAAASAGGSDAADISNAGIPAIDSIGVRGDYIHSLQERAVLSSLKECAKRIAVVALNI